jgi:transposase InsO family protein
MKEEGLKGLSGKRKGPKTTDSNHNGPIAPNHLKQMNVTKAHKVWAMDITYIECGGSWAYLAAVLDLHLHKIVGWEVSDTIDSALVESALKQAVMRQGMPEKVTVHSDRGSQYASRSFIGLVESLGYQRSMSAKGNCYDNAAMESFFGVIKREELDRWDMLTLSCVRNRVFDYIETYYNRERIHTSIGMTPSQFEELEKKELHRALAGADRPPPMRELENKATMEYEQVT